MYECSTRLTQTMRRTQPSSSTVGWWRISTHRGPHECEGKTSLRCKLTAHSAQQLWGCESAGCSTVRELSRFTPCYLYTSCDFLKVQTSAAAETVVTYCHCGRHHCRCRCCSCRHRLPVSLPTDLPGASQCDQSQ